MIVTNVCDLKEITKEVRELLKKEFPDCRFSVTMQRNTLRVALMSAPVSPLKADAQVFNGHTDINHYHLSRSEYLTNAGKKLFTRINKIANEWSWDRSDSQSDYFDVNYYLDMSVGKWDKPFQVKK